ncbi:hypothetical protein JW964_02090 [candidate division KSB1 bacterium]|nr:hypothetical protein [candidate division KSB1 bacterium]
MKEEKLSEEIISKKEPVVSEEFERESVPKTHLKGLRSFIGMYAGEHTAGTEFTLGPLFVAHGVTAFDLLVGLLVGNLLAVLSWRFITAPIATRVRQTMYYHLERICGAQLVTIYNLANGLMFCFLAGAMVSVSATAVGLPFNMTMPGLNDWMPNSIGWVIVVLIVGAVIAIVAAKGYEAVSHVANIAAPWMVMVFIACGLAVLPQLNIHSFSDFYTVLKDNILTGRVIEGQSKFTFWHVVAFAWFCNLAMHIGMADLSIFRFAKKSNYGYATATGMYLGHYIAWIAAALLYALQLQKDPGNTTVAPGPLAIGIAGFAGAVCVVIAGWTTANPTIYRAGLAFQIIFKKRSRFTVTLIAGGLATIAGIFPALVMKLLDFVALYGLVLMPMGAVIFMDYWVIPKLGMKSFFAEIKKIKFNWAAGAAWIATLLICLWLNIQAGIEIFFLAIPGWFIASAIYIGLSKVIQRNALIAGGK